MRFGFYSSAVPQLQVAVTVIVDPDAVIVVVVVSLYPDAVIVVVSTSLLPPVTAMVEMDVE